MSNIVIKECAYVHDNEIDAYHVDFKNNILHLETNYYGKKRVDIIFTGLLAHSLYDVISYNIIFNITHVTVDYYVEEYKNELNESMKYSFPAFVSSVKELREYLYHNNYNVYEIGSSIGLSGIVIAKEVDIIVKEL